MPYNILQRTVHICTHVHFNFNFNISRFQKPFHCMSIHLKQVIMMDQHRQRPGCPLTQRSERINMPAGTQSLQERPKVVPRHSVLNVLHEVKRL